MLRDSFKEIERNKKKIERKTKQNRMSLLTI